jgi:3-hydroxyacyl-CoA dehydrogenase
MRDGLHGLREVERLAQEHGFVKAVYLVDKVSRDWLLRPMGIFQLIDYVGVDVFQLILRVMEKYLQDGLHSPLIDRYLELGVKGGQTSSGAQKDGFLKYDKGRIVGVYDHEHREYVALDEAWIKATDELLGPHPEPKLSWKSLQRDPELDQKLRGFFQKCKESSSPGIELAKAHFLASRETSLRLVQDGVANSAEDVNKVLTLGFFHLYGPVNDYL